LTASAATLAAEATTRHAARRPWRMVLFILFSPLAARAAP
jgi:hypothetical protein